MAYEKYGDQRIQGDTGSRARLELHAHPVILHLIHLPAWVGKGAPEILPVTIHVYDFIRCYMIFYICFL